jgi:signal peptidase I
MRHSSSEYPRRPSSRRSLAFALVATLLVTTSGVAGCSFVTGSEGATEAPDPSAEAAAQDGDGLSDEEPVSGSQTVPGVVGSDVATAREAMDEAGFHTKLRWVFSTSGFRTVLDQTRVAGESASAGSLVELMVSLGPAPPAPSPVVVPASAFASSASPSSPNEEVAEVYPTSPSAPPPPSAPAEPSPTSPSTPAPTDPTPVSDVPRGPMEPTIDETETITYDSDAYVADAPRVGDVVAFGSDQGMAQALRVVGVAGDSVRIVNGRVERNGALVDEPYVVYGLDSSYAMDAATAVPEGKVFVVGDNRAALALYDWGLIAVDSIDGKVVFE